VADTTGFYFHNYQDWRDGLTQRCKIKITPEYARERINALNDQSDLHTQEFAAKYGESYLKQVIQWFEEAEKTA